MGAVADEVCSRKTVGVVRESVSARQEGLLLEGVPRARRRATASHPVVRAPSYRGLADVPAVITLSVWEH